MSYTLDDKPGEENSFGVTKAVQTSNSPKEASSKVVATADELELLNGLITSDKTLRKRAFTTLLRAIASGRGV